MAVAEQTPISTQTGLATAAGLRHPPMLIDGAWVDSMSGKSLSVENPASDARSPRSHAAMRLM